VSEQKRTRKQAFDVVFKALNLAQDLDFLSDLRSPEYLKLSTKLSRKKLIETLKENHELNVANTEFAYELLALIGDWADEYPLEEENK
jgi:ABC-type lipoprotein export system ATPase subunit